jgi:hypothetical protein
MVAVYIPALVYRATRIVHHADIRQHHLEIRGLDIVPDQVFDFGHVLLVTSMRVPVGTFHVHGELPGVGLRKEGHAEERIDSQARHENTPISRPPPSAPGRFRARRTQRS